MTKPSRSAIAADREPGRSRDRATRRAAEVGPVGERCRARWRQGQVRTAHQRGDEFGEVERVARRSFRLA